MKLHRQETLCVALKHQFELNKWHFLYFIFSVKIIYFTCKLQYVYAVIIFKNFIFMSINVLFCN